MTQRKPADLSFDSWIDQQIERARKEGLFDDLPGRGRPQAGLDRELDPLWWAKDLLRREQLEVLPPALAIRRQVERFREALGTLRSEGEVRAGLAALNAEIRALNRSAPAGPPTRQAVLDEEEVLAAWRALRADATRGETGA